MRGKRIENLEDILNTRFTYLIVKEYAGIEERTQKDRIRKIHKYKCLCDCGNIKIINRLCLLTSNVQSCGCLQSKNRNIKFYEDVKNGIRENPKITKLYGLAKTKANQRNKEFNLIKEEYKRFILSKCHYCGESNSNTFERSFKHNGIDRIDSSKGYIIDNCLSCCKTCNRAKNDLSYIDFINWINKLKRFNNGC